LVRIGEGASEKLDVIPPQLRVIRTVRPKYACHNCEGSGDEQRPAVRIAAMPPAIIDKGIVTSGLLAYIVTSKFCDALPLYRQEKQFQRIGVELSRRTMADWMIAASEACLPLMEVLESRLR
jgi:transposase